MVPRLLLCAVLLALLAPASAGAGPVVLYGPGLDADAAGDLVEQKLKTDAIKVVGPLAAQIGVKGATAVAVGAPSVGCEKPAKRPLKGEFLMVDRQMSEMEYATVRVTIDKIVEQIACYGVDASRDDLYTLFFTQAMAAYYDEDSVGTQKAFSQAVAIDPSRPWPQQYPPTAKPLYDEALRIMTASAPSKVVASVAGEVRVNGEKDYGKPVLYPGGHLVFVPESSTSLWVTIPRAPAMSEDGLLITTSAELLLGLLGGNDKYGPWLAALAQKEGWAEVALASKDGVVVFKNGGFFDASGNKIKRAEGGGTVQRAQADPATIAGIALIGIGAGTGAVGAGLNVSSFNQGLPKIGSTLIPRSEYDQLKTRNTAGLALTVTGAGIAVAGIVVTIASVTAPQKMAVVPWFTADDTSVGFGLAGSLP